MSLQNAAVHQANGTFQPKNNRYWVVVDTSVLVSALYFGGTAQETLLHIAKFQQLILSDYIIEELLDFSKYTTPKTPRRMLSLFRQAFERYVQPHELHEVAVRDVNDIPVMQLAIEYNAMIVTGDRDILEHGMGAKVTVLSVEEYGELFS